MKNKTKYRIFKLLQWSLRLGLVMTIRQCKLNCVSALI